MSSRSSTPTSPSSVDSETVMMTRQSKLEVKKQKKDAADAFWCPVFGVSQFSVDDIFNNNITLKGYQCKHAGTMVGSLYISEIAGHALNKPQLIYGSPKLSYPYRKGTTEYLQSFDRDSKSNINSYFLSQKWNGTNISFFKYRDHEDKLRIAAKTKGCALLTDTQYGNFLTETLKALKIEKLQDLDVLNSPPEILKEFVNTEAYQSITLEMCGQDIPHLVKYPFEIALKPLFYTTHDGRIKPITNAKDIIQHGPREFNSNQEVIQLCENLQREALQANIEYRARNGLKHKYEYEHFVTEGFVLYLCDAGGYLINRIMYKIKPSDIEEVHWSTFDEKRKAQVKDVLKKMKERELDILDEELFRCELDMAEKEWKRFSKEVLAFRDELESGISPVVGATQPHMRGRGRSRSTFSHSSSKPRGKNTRNTADNLHIKADRVADISRRANSLSSESSSPGSPQVSRGSPRSLPTNRGSFINRAASATNKNMKRATSMSLIN